MPENEEEESGAEDVNASLEEDAEEASSMEPDGLSMAEGGRPSSLTQFSPSERGWPAVAVPPHGHGAG